MYFNQYRARKNGDIKRCKRDPQSLTPGQRRMATDLADMYGVSDEQARTFLDYYYALKRGWIDEAQFCEETALEAPKIVKAL
jgi:hypothetical protein